MGRPKDSCCRQCRRPLPDEAARDELTAGTDVCLRCASVSLNQAYRSREGKQWLAGWMGRLQGALRLKA